MCCFKHTEETRLHNSFMNFEVNEMFEIYFDSSFGDLIFKYLIIL